MNENFVQCLLTKYDDGDCLKTVSWLPEKFAVKYKVLKLKNEKGLWSDGWVVQETYGCKNLAYILAHERDFAKQRKASDI